MLMVRFGKGVVMNTPLTSFKGNLSNVTNSIASVDSRRSCESVNPVARNRLSDRIYAVPRVSLKNNLTSDSYVKDRINNLNKRSAIIDKMISLHFPKSMDSTIDIAALKKAFEQENDNIDQLLHENSKFYTITSSIQHSNDKEKNEVLNEIDNNLTGYSPSQSVLQFINKNKSNFISKF